jgi:hypothetical protein
MKLFIFRTDIKTKKKVKIVKPIFNNHPEISGWNIDLEDIDNVLRIETSEKIADKDIINWVRKVGFYCELLLN